MSDVDANGMLVPALAAHIESRMTALGIDGPAALARAAGVSPEGIKPLLRGVRKAYQSRLTRPVCDALGWSRDSIALILDGGEPVEVEPVNGPPLILTLDQFAERIESRLSELAVRSDAQSAQLAAMMETAESVLRGLNAIAALLPTLSPGTRSAQPQP